VVVKGNKVRLDEAAHPSAPSSFRVPMDL